ncbi:MAG: hydrogenase maturation protease [Thermoplasmata archaeon]|jgi:hydrogenase maturation protease
MSEPTSSNPSRPGSLPLVIGLGNDHRNDDASGLEVARALRPHLEGKARVEECVSEGIALLDLWRGAERVLVVDAVRSGAQPGTVHRLEPGDGRFPGFRTGTSTHGLSLAEAVALAKGLGCLPRHLVVYGIEADNVEIGTGLTPSVALGVKEATARILAELEADRSMPPSAKETAHA